MENNALKNIQDTILEGSTPKKLWITPEGEIISVNVGTVDFGIEGRLTTTIFVGLRYQS